MCGNHTDQLTKDFEVTYFKQDQIPIEMWCEEHDQGACVLKVENGAGGKDEKITESCWVRGSGDCYD